MTFDVYSPIIDALESDLLQTAERAPADWRDRIPRMFGAYFWHPFSEAHAEMWEWADAIRLDSRPRPFVAIWSRGRGKSTTAEAVAADAGARGARHYCMYVSGTQDQADKHVQTIARMLESDAVTQFYPDVGRPKVGKNGSRSWSRRTVTTASGFTIEAVGLNKAVRGQKIDWARPDMIILDDVDEKHDTENTTGKKAAIITDSILPAGSPNCAVLFVQNLIQSDSIAAALATDPNESGAALFLMDRQISGPFPAVEGLQYEAQPRGDATRWVITAGRSLWDGFDLRACEDELNRVGPTAYLLEYQHEVDADNPNALLTEADFNRTRVIDTPPLARACVAIDPAASSGTTGIIVGGRAQQRGIWHGYTLEDATTPAGAKPEEWALAALKAYARHDADFIAAEVNNGGDMVESVIRGVKWVVDGKVLVDGARVRVVQVRASRGKAVRAEPVSVLFEQGVAHHVGHMPELEKQWRQWQPDDRESPDRLDAEVWMYTALELTGADSAMVAQPAQASRWGGAGNDLSFGGSRWRRDW